MRGRCGGDDADRRGHSAAGKDRCRISDLRRMGKIRRRLSTAIQAYPTAPGDAALSKADDRIPQTRTFAATLDAAADVMDHAVTTHAARRLKQSPPPNPAGQAETDGDQRAAESARRHDARRRVTGRLNTGHNPAVGYKPRRSRISETPSARVSTESTA